MNLLVKSPGSAVSLLLQMLSGDIVYTFSNKNSQIIPRFFLYTLAEKASEERVGGGGTTPVTSV